MTVRRRQPSLSGTSARDAIPPSGVVYVRPDGPVPGVPPQPVDEPMILGFPAVVEGDDTGEPSPGPDPWAEGRAATAAGEFGLPVRLVTLLRADPVAGIALVLAGVAALGSLWLPWWRGDAVTGQALVRRGLAAAGSGSSALGRTVGLWEPPAIVLGGMLLLLLGVLLFLPSRTHRVGGLLALVIAMGVAAAVLLQVAQVDWNSDRFGPGMWAAVVVAALGILGALKAMLTAPRVTLRISRPGD
jgi:hypothetical protein